MQNDPYSHSPFSLLGSRLDALEVAFQRAHADPGTTAPHGSAPAIEPSEGVEPDGERVLDGDELLRVAREPIEWLLALADRLASGQSDEVAAIGRLRAALRGWLAGRAIGVRLTDVLVAFALLVAAIDPNVVLQAVTRTVAYEDAVLAQRGRVVDREPAKPVHHARGSRSRRCQATRATTR